MQREKIKVCNEFTHAFSGTGFFNKSFPSYGHTGSGYNKSKQVKIFYLLSKKAKTF